MSQPLWAQSGLVPGPGGAGPAGAGPAVVALGGGHGLATTLCAVVGYAQSLTAVVSVADDGGSSGRLREVWDGPAPGDVRRCLLALASPGTGPEGVWAKAFSYRFPEGELAGHSLGNLVLVALSEVTGDFSQAARQMAALLGVKATVLPATSCPVQLCAEVIGPQGRAELVGQVKIAHSNGVVRRIWLRPPSPPAHPDAIDAIARADQVVIGPGSLFTSVLAVCAVPGVRDALVARRGGRVYVCNLSTQEGETTGLDADAHLRALAQHGVPLDTVICDPSTRVGAPSADVVAALWGDGAPRVVEAAVSRPNGHSHDAPRLGEVLAELAAGKRAED